jgi:hypothetical protein
MNNAEAFSGRTLFASTCGPFLFPLSAKIFLSHPPE